MKEIILMSILIFTSCTSSNKKEDSVKINPESQIFYPAGQKENILDENGNQVSITSEDHPLFQKESKSTDELFRVVVSSDFYKIRQIRQTENIKRKPDLGGDSFIMEELQKYNKKDFTDDGIISVKINANTGKIETANTERNTRIQQLLKIIQGDSTRWVLEHKSEKPLIIKYNIVYNIILSNKSNREQIKEDLKKEVKK